MPNNALQGVLGGTANFLNAIDAFMTDNSIDVMYKAFAFLGFLWTLYFLPFTRQFAPWATLAILFILMLQSSPTQNVSAVPAASTLPMPTQINTPTPGPAGTASGSPGASSSSGNPLGSAISTIASIAGLFGL